MVRQMVPDFSAVFLIRIHACPDPLTDKRAKIMRQRHRASQNRHDHKQLRDGSTQSQRYRPPSQAGNPTQNPDQRYQDKNNRRRIEPANDKKHQDKATQTEKASFQQPDTRRTRFLIAV